MRDFVRTCTMEITSVDVTRSKLHHNHWHCREAIDGDEMRSDDAIIREPTNNICVSKNVNATDKLLINTRTWG